MSKQRRRLRDLWAPLHQLLSTNERLTRPTRRRVCGLTQTSLICVNMPAARTMGSRLIIVRSNKVVNAAKEGFSFGDEKNAELLYSSVTVSTENVHEFVSAHVSIVINGAKVVTALLLISVTTIFSYIVNSKGIRLCSYANCSCFNEGSWLQVPRHGGSCCGGSGRKRGSSRVQWRPRHEAPGQGGTGRPVFM